MFHCTIERVERRMYTSVLNAISFILRSQIDFCAKQNYFGILIDQITFQMGVYTLEMKVKIGQEVRLFCKPNSKQHILEK